MKRVFKSKLVIALTICLLTFGLTMGVTYAWYRIIVEGNINLSTSELGGELKFYLSGVLVDDSNEYYDDEFGTLTLNGIDETAVNYVGKFSVRVSIDTDIAVRFRVKILDEWRTRRILDAIGEDGNPILTDWSILYFDVDEDGNFPERFNVASTFSHIYGDDRFIYYLGTNYGIVNKGTTFNDVLVYSGGIRYVPEIAEDSTICEVKVSAALEIVQANRFSQIWGVADDLYY